jgi:hypothetical protein
MALDSVLDTVSQNGSSKTVGGAITSNERVESNSTEVTVYLGDDNDGDEFVVEMYRSEDTQWITALSSEPSESDLDFFLYGKEDNYGFIANLNWLLDGVVGEGTYEILVECRCITSGGPTDLDIYRTSSITGVYDVTPPKLFGKPLPLSDEILLGEELVFVFTEPLQCSNVCCLNKVWRRKRKQSSVFSQNSIPRRSDCYLINGRELCIFGFILKIGTNNALVHNLINKGLLIS